MFCPFQKTLKELFPSYKDVLKHEKVVAFTCGLMKDPTPLVNHAYEMYMEYVYDSFNPDCESEIVRQLHAQGKDIIDLFCSMYRESRISLRGLPGYNQYIYWNAMYKGDIDTPSKLYFFNAVTKDDVPNAKFTNGSDEATECMLWIEKPDAVAAKTLLATCSEISRRQPVNVLVMLNVHCDNLIPEEMLTFSKNVQSVVLINTDLALNFWQNIFHQLSDCQYLRHLWLVNSHLHQLEEDLNELLEYLDRRDPAKPQLNVQLLQNNFSKKFVRKWGRPGSVIECHFDDIYGDSDSSDNEEDFNLDEINWLIEEHYNPKFPYAEQGHPVGGIYLSRESITTDLVNTIVMSVN